MNVAFESSVQRMLFDSAHLPEGTTAQGQINFSEITVLVRDEMGTQAFYKVDYKISHSLR